MIVGLQLQKFRSYTDSSFEFDGGANIIVGANASGKTNLLEAVLMVARGSSYRVKDSDLVQFGQPWARLDGRMVDDDVRVVKLQRSESVGQVVKTFEINEQPMSRMLAGKQLPVVLFEPDHLHLLSGAPDLRRNFLDDLLEQTDISYGKIRKDYKRVLLQRNIVLKQNPIDLSAQLFVWNVRLAELGDQIVRARTSLIDAFNEKISGIYSEIATTNNTIALVYESKFPAEQYGTHMLKKLESNNHIEAQRGYTLYGPHRDDLSLLINGTPVNETASRGELRTLLLSLKVLELQIIERARGKKPILLLDDVFSELDGKRRQALTRFVSSYQTFITTTDADLVVQHFTESARIIPIAQ